MVKISVISPTCREGSLDMVKKCLSRQSFQDWEWIVVSPFPYHFANHWVPDPPKPEGYTYALNRSWNAGIKKAKGELFVSIVDLLWFPPNVLDDLWAHYVFDKQSCVGAIGHQYERLENEKPEGLVWTDPRVKEEPFYQVPPNDFELCLASLPLEGIRGVGGFEEEFDRYAALSEKELCERMAKLGYTFWIDQTLEYRALSHPRLTKDWDEKYQQGIVYFNQCLREVQSGKRLVLPYLSPH